VGEIFERAMPAIPLEWTGERLTTATSGQAELEHLHRYFLARNFCRGLDVLDVASGEGYGTALLAQVARSAIGVEISADATAHAYRAYSAPNLRFLTGDACRLPLKDASVDAVVSFETIEHFYEHEQFLAEVCRVLRADGFFIVSSPERDVYSPSGSSANPYHVRELTKAEFEALLQTSFSHVYLMAQRPMLGSAIVSDGSASGRALTFEKRGPRHYEASEGLPRPMYLVAIASNHSIANVPDSLYIETAEIGAVIQELPELRRRVESAENEMAAAKNQLASINKASLDHATRAKALESALAEARVEAAFACSQRDLARRAARRAAAAAEGAWHAQVAELNRQVAESDQQAVELKRQVEEWRRRYLGLRGRLEAILRRFWILRVSRLFPVSMRRFIRERMLGPVRQ